MEAKPQRKVPSIVMLMIEKIVIFVPSYFF